MEQKIDELPWRQAGWREAAEGWIEAQLASHGLALEGSIEQPHVRPWSTVLRVPSTGGLLYFKAVGLVLGHEPALTAALARWRPDCMPEVLADDPARGWLLMRDSGTPLRVLIRADGHPRRWQAVLPLFAEVQMEMAGRCDELLALGALDRRLASLPAEFERLLADRESFLIDQAEGMSSAGFERLRTLGPRLAEDCQRLGALGLPESLHHDDFHDGNIFVRGERCTFTDWGESAVGHPFFTTVVMLRNAAHTLGLPAEAPELAAVRDSYLEPWQALAPRRALMEAFALAQRVGMFCRALTWHRVVVSLPEPYRAENAEAVPGWMGEFLWAMTSQL